MIYYNYESSAFTYVYVSHYYIIITKEKKCPYQSPSIKSKVTTFFILLLCIFVNIKQYKILKWIGVDAHHYETNEGGLKVRNIMGTG